MIISEAKENYFLEQVTKRKIVMQLYQPIFDQELYRYYPQVQLMNAIKSMICEEGYTLVKKLGQGTFASVMSAINNKNNQKVAIKQVYVQRPFLEQAQDEVAKLQKLQNDHIIKLIDHFYDSSQFYLNVVMELCKGSLRDQIQSRQMYDEESLLSFLVQMTSAFLELQSNKVMHLDFKPENVLIADDEGKHYKICDFGCAQISQISRMSGYEKSAFGTLNYLAPEVYLNYQGQKTRSSADMWSFGITLYEMIFWRLPFPVLEDGNIDRKYAENYFKKSGYQIKFDAIEQAPHKIIEVVKLMLAPLPVDRITWKQLKQRLIEKLGVNEYLFMNTKEVVPTFISVTELLLKAIRRIRDKIQSGTHMFWKGNTVFLQELRQILIKYTYIICLKFNIGVSYKLPQLEDPQKRMKVAQLLEEVTKERLTCKNKIKEFEAKELDYLETLFADQLKVCREKLEAHRASMDPDMGLLYCICGDLGDIFAKKSSPSPFDNIDYLSKSLKVKI